MKKGKKSSDDPHVRIYLYMMESKAYQILSCRATWLYSELKREWKGGDENHILLSYSKIKERKKLHNTQISRAILELIEYGFIGAKPGGLFKKCSVYSLSNKWMEFSKNTDQLKKIPAIIEAKIQAHKSNYKKSMVREKGDTNG